VLHRLLNIHFYFNNIFLIFLAGHLLPDKCCLVFCNIVLVGKLYTEVSEKAAASIFKIEIKFFYNRSTGKI
jgi:hypothetical protein